MVIHDRETTNGHGKESRIAPRAGFASHSLRSWSPSPNRNARRTQRVTQRYQRVKGQINQLRLERLPSSFSQSSMSVLYTMPVAASRSISPYVVNNHHRKRSSCPTLALQCVSFVPARGKRILISPTSQQSPGCLVTTRVPPGAFTSRLSRTVRDNSLTARGVNFVKHFVYL